MALTGYSDQAGNLWDDRGYWVGVGPNAGLYYYDDAWRDRPPGDPLPATHKEELRDVFRGLWEVWRTPGLLPLLSMHFFAYATMMTVLGIWGGPYLFDVHGLDSVQRGNVLLAMGIAQTAGILAYGPMDRVLRSRKKVVMAGTMISAALLIVLAAVARPPLWLAADLYPSHQQYFG